MRLVLLAIAFLPISSAADNTICRLSSTILIPDNSDAVLPLTVRLLPEATALPVPGGRYRIWYDGRLIAERDFVPPQGSTIMQILIGRPSAGFHLFGAEYFDPASRSGWCVSNWKPTFVGGQPSTPRVLAFPTNRDLFFKEQQGLMAIGSPLDFQAWFNILLQAQDITDRNKL